MIAPTENISTVPAMKLTFFSKSRLMNERSVAVVVWTANI
jgi:hypothetical protein